MGLIEEPYIMALVAGVLQYLTAKYPEYQDAISAMLVALGYGGGACILRAVNGGVKTTNGGTSSV